MVRVQRLTANEINNINLSGFIIYNTTSNQLYYNNGTSNILIIDNNVITDQIINFLSNVTLGIAQSNKVLTLDSNKNISGINSIQLIQPLDEIYGGTGSNVYNVGDILVADSSSTLKKLSVSSNNGDFLTTDSSSNIGISWNSNLFKNYIKFCDPTINSITSYTFEYLYAKVINNLSIENATIDLNTTGLNGIAVSQNLTGNVFPNTTSTTIVGTGTLFTNDFIVGDIINISGQYRRITSIVSNTSLVVDSLFTLLNTWTLAGTATMSTTQKKYGSKSLNATASTAYGNLVIGSISGFSALNSTWCIDFFFFLNATNANLALLTSTTGFSFTITYVSGSTRLALSLG